MPNKPYRNEKGCVYEEFCNDVPQKQRSVNPVKTLISKIDKQIRSRAGRSWSDPSQPHQLRHQTVTRQDTLL